MFGLPAVCYAKGFLFTFLGFVGMVIAMLALAGIFIGASLGLLWVWKKIMPKGTRPLIKDTDKFANRVIIIIAIAGYIYVSLQVAQGICQ